MNTPEKPKRPKEDGQQPPPEDEEALEKALAGTDDPQTAAKSEATSDEAGPVQEPAAITNTDRKAPTDPERPVATRELDHKAEAPKVEDTPATATTDEDEGLRISLAVLDETQAILDKAKKTFDAAEADAASSEEPETPVEEVVKQAEAAPDATSGGSADEAPTSSGEKPPPQTEDRTEPAAPKTAPKQAPVNASAPEPPKPEGAFTNILRVVFGWK